MTNDQGRSLAATRPATLRLSYCLVRGHLLSTSAWTFSRSYYEAAPCMSGSGIINHPRRDEPGLKTEKVNHHSSEYSSPATHVRQSSWGNVCVTRCMFEYSREHSCVYVVGIIQYWERVLISALLFPGNLQKKKIHVMLYPRETFSLICPARAWGQLCFVLRLTSRSSALSHNDICRKTGHAGRLTLFVQNDNIDLDTWFNKAKGEESVCSPRQPQS